VCLVQHRLGDVRDELRRPDDVLAVSYFAAAWLGHNVKAEILVEHLTRMSRQICETPDFHYYALAAGLKMAFMRHGKWSRVIDERKSPQLELSLDWG